MFNGGFMAQTNSMKLIPALLLVAFSGAASASGFQLMEQNASGIGNAYAGSAAVAENASTIYYNPAGMTQLQAREVSGGLAAVDPSFRFSNKGSSVGTLANTGEGGDAGGWAFVPNGYVSWALSKDLYVGVGIGAPFGLKTEYDDRWIGAAQSSKFEIKTININPSIAYRVNESVSLGAGVNWQQIKAEYVRLATAGGAASPTLPLGDRVTSKMNLEDSAWGWNLGGLFTLSPSTKVGVSYRSQVKYHTDGDVKLTGDGSAGGNATAAALIGLGRQSDVAADLTVPDTFIMSVTQKLSDKWEMLGDVSWTGWSSIPKVDIMRTSGSLNGQNAQTLDTDFRDTWRVALGSNYAYSNAWKLKFGVAYDQTPVKGQSTRLVSLPDNDRVWFSFGTQWTPDKTSRLDLGMTYIYVRDSKINNDQTAAGRGLVAGDYSGSIWVLGGQYSMSF
jgi:long-chain fatty acid transport protein